MQSKTYNISFNTNYLEHIGNKNSGRYPRSSGENPYQHEGQHSVYETLTKKHPILNVVNPSKAANQMEHDLRNNEWFKSNATKLINQNKQYEKIYDDLAKEFRSNGAKVKDKSLINAYKEANKILSDASEYSEKIVNNIVGDYGDVKLKVINMDMPIKEFVNNIINKDSNLSDDLYIYKNKENYMKRAKENDWYLMEFLETSGDIEDKKILLKAYSKYLESPSVYAWDDRFLYEAYKKK